MIIKIVGSVLVIFASFAFFYEYSRKYVRRVAELEELNFLLTMLEGEMFYNLNPLPVAFSNISRGRKGVSDIFAAAAEYIGNKEGAAVPGIFSRAIGEAKGGLHLNAEDFRIIEDFSAGLSSADIESQRGNINAAREKIMYRINAARDESKKLTKLYIYLGILAGLMIVILLF